MIDAPFNMLGKKAPPFSPEPEKPSRDFLVLVPVELKQPEPEPLPEPLTPPVKPPRKRLSSYRVIHRRGYGEYDMWVVLYDDGSLGFRSEEPLPHESEFFIKAETAKVFLRFIRNSIGTMERENFVAKWTGDDEGRKSFSILFSFPHLVWASSVMTTRDNAMRLYRQMAPLMRSFDIVA